VVVFHFHGSSGYNLLQVEGRGFSEGVFSLRSRTVPMHRQLGPEAFVLDDNRSKWKSDILDQTPILDIKPYKPSDYPGVCEGA
jgi:tRNA (Thr-GGU) A37 N-methylase